MIFLWPQMIKYSHSLLMRTAKEDTKSPDLGLDPSANAPALGSTPRGRPGTGAPGPHAVRGLRRSTEQVPPRPNALAAAEAAGPKATRRGTKQSPRCGQVEGSVLFFFPICPIFYYFFRMFVPCVFMLSRFSRSLCRVLVCQLTCANEYRGSDVAR